MLSASQHLAGGAALRAYSAGVLRAPRNPKNLHLLSQGERLPSSPVLQRRFTSVSDSETDRPDLPPRDGMPRPSGEGEEIPLDPLTPEEEEDFEEMRQNLAEEPLEEVGGEETGFQERHPAEGEEEEEEGMLSSDTEDVESLMSVRRLEEDRFRSFMNRVASMDFKEHEVPGPFRYVDEVTGEPLGYWEDFHTGEKRLVTETEWRREYERMDRELGRMTRKAEREATYNYIAKKSVAAATETHGAEAVQEFMSNPWREDHPLLEDPDAIRVRPWELKLPLDQELAPNLASSERRFRDFTKEEMRALYLEGLKSLNPMIADLHDQRYLRGFEDALYLNDSSAEDGVFQGQEKEEEEPGAEWKYRYSELFQQDKFDLAETLGVNHLRHPNWESPLFLLQPDLQLPETEPRRKDYLAELARRRKKDGIRNPEGKTIEEISNEELFDFEPYIDGQAEAEAEETGTRVEEKPSLYRGRELDARTPDDSIFAAGSARLVLRGKLLDQDPTLFDAPGMDEFRAMHYQRIFKAVEERRGGKGGGRKASAFKVGHSVLEGEELSESDLERQRQEMRSMLEWLSEEEKEFRMELDASDGSASPETLSDEDVWGYPTMSRNLDVLEDEEELRQPNFYYDMYEEELLRKQIDPGHLAPWRVLAEGFIGETPDSTLTQRVRDAMYKYHLLDPVKYSPRILAQLFGISVSRVTGYLKLSAAKERLTARGFPVIRSEFLDFMSQGVQISDDHNIVPFIREAHIDFEQTSTHITDVPQLDAYWDPPRLDSQRSHSDIRFVDDFVTMDLENLERSRHERWLSKSERALKAEQRRLAFTGPIGSDRPAKYRPKLLDENLRRPSRHKTVLVDISDIKNANYRIAIQDRAGRVREPNVTEWEWIRTKERNRRTHFNYLRWKQARRYFPRAAHHVPSSSSSSASASSHSAPAAEAAESAV